MRLGSRGGRTLLVAGLLLAATTLAVAGEGPTLGAHHDGGRFTTAAEGFPPQLEGMRDIGPVAVTAPRSSPADADAVAVALADPRVSAVLGERHEVFTPWVAGPTEAHPGATVVTAYGHDAAATVTATVADGAVVEVATTPAGEWQMPLTGAERDAAVAIARDHLLAAGVDRVADLEGFAIHALEPDGTPFDTRVAYASFHADVDARPEHVAWVDLTAGVVTSAREEAPPQALTGALPAHRQARQDVPREGHVDWNGWSFDYAVSGRIDGVSLSDVTWQGTRVLARASMPAMTVFYDHPPGTPPEDTCGPYVDRLGPPELTPVYWADDADVVLREFTQQGQDWLEIGILDTLGAYVLYQSFYIGADGQIDAHTFAKGLQCHFDHLHYPFWRLDVDLDGGGADQIVRTLEDGTREVMTSEFDLGAADAHDHGWLVRDPVSGHQVRIAFDDGTWNVPGEVVPEVLYEPNRVYGRVVDPLESGMWRTRASTELPHNDGQSLEDADVVLWYRGYLPHTPEEGPDLWHSTGVRLDVDLARPFYGRRG